MRRIIDPINYIYVYAVVCFSLYAYLIHVWINISKSFSFYCKNYDKQQCARSITSFELFIFLHLYIEQYTRVCARLTLKTTLHVLMFHK